MGAMLSQQPAQPAQAGEAANTHTVPVDVKDGKQQRQLLVHRHVRPEGREQLDKL